MDNGYLKEMMDRIENLEKKSFVWDSQTLSRGCSETSFELRLQERKRNNVIIFGLPEVTPADIHGEKVQVEDFLRDLGCDVALTNCHLFRVGIHIEKNRPLVLKLNCPEAKSKILYVAKGLKYNEKWKGVSITHDLTKLQCQREKVKEVELKKMAEEKNSQLSEIQRSKKIWKVVGGRGTRGLALKEI